MRQLNGFDLWKAVPMVLLWTSLALGQTYQGRIAGMVTDAGSGLVPGVEVIAINEDTGVRTKAESNEAGLYLLSALPPGKYTFLATKSGFKRYERKGLAVETARALTLNVQLELGNVSESIVVTAEAPLLESSTATVSQFVDSRSVQEMPLSGRRAMELVRLAGGVVFVDYSASTRVPNFSLAGGRVQNQMYWVDGGSIQNMRMGVGQASMDPPVEVIQEFRVVQNTYSAEFGGSAGGVIISTTKTGTNQFHGSGFEFFRNDRLNAANFFAPAEGTRKVKAPLRYNLFGATLGGPIIRNKTHFFAGYEGTRRGDGSTQILTVPTLLQRQGDFTDALDSRGLRIPIHDPATASTSGGQTRRDPFPGNIIPANRFDAVAKQLIEYWPLPNRPPVNVSGAGNFAGNLTEKFTRDNVTARLDHVFTDKNRFYFRLLYNHDPFTRTTVYPKKEADPINNFGPGSWQSSYLFSDTHIAKPNLIAETRFTFGNDYWWVRSAGLGSNIVEQIGLKGAPPGAFPAMSVPGVAGLGSSNERRQFPIQQAQVVNNWTYIKGKHIIKFGAEARRSRNHEINRPSISGQYGFAATATGLPGNTQTGFGFASFLLGQVNSLTLRATDELDRHNWYLAGFLQDDWKIARKLTLNIGLRWETDTPFTDSKNRLSGFDSQAVNPVSGTPGVVRFAGINGWPTSAYSADWNNFGPRFGFAWTPGDGGKWVLRGGFGIAFDHPFGHGVPNSASLGFETSASLTSPDNGITPAFVLGQGVPVTPGAAKLDDSFGSVPAGRAPNTSVSFYERNRRTGYAQQFSFGVQRSLPGDVVFEISYLGNMGRKVPLANLNMNQVPPSLMGPGNAQVRRPFPQFNDVLILVPTMGANNYHAGVVRLEKRLSRGISFLGTYTWSRNIGNVDQASGFGDDQIFQDYYNRKLDKGPLSIDIVHRFVWSSIYDLPAGKGRRWLRQGLSSMILGGWSVGAIATVQSGGPYTVQMQTNTTNSFSAGALRANVLRDGNLPPERRTLQRWFDIDAFQAPAANTFGNAGRGILRGDGRTNFDFSINKNFHFLESRFVQFRGEFFNAFNHPNFGLPGHALGSPAVGTVTSATSPRTVQLGLRMVF